MGIKIKPPTCPECGSVMVLRTTHKFFYPNGQPRKFWGCPCYPSCQATHGAHSNGKPLVSPGDAETKAARIKAHQLFDRLWKSGAMSRPDAYQVLRKTLGLSRNQCHIAKFTSEQCLKVIELFSYEASEASEASGDGS